jgi:hypothetical protein
MTGDPAVEAYLRAAADSMAGPRRERSDILAELRSGLLDAIDAHHVAGLPAQGATEAAITEFGDPHEVASAFRPHLAMIQARRTALAIAATGPLVGLLWAAAALASHITLRHAPPWQWPGAPPLSAAAFPAIAAAVFILITSTVTAIAATGKLSRWLKASARTAVAAAATAGFTAMAADLAILTLLGCQLASAPGTLDPIPVAAATAASLTRLTLARRAARNCLAVRATLA